MLKKMSTLHQKSFISVSQNLEQLVMQVRMWLRKQLKWTGKSSNFQRLYPPPSGDTCASHTGQMRITTISWRM